MLDLSRIGCEMGGTGSELCLMAGFSIKNVLLPELVLSKMVVFDLSSLLPLLYFPLPLQY